MGLLGDVQDFARMTRDLSAFPELEAHLAAISSDLGFQYFALMHHTADPLALRAAHVSNYPEAWIEMVVRRRYWADDPVALACQRSVASFAWKDLGQIIALTGRQREILSHAAKAGLSTGYTVPATAPGELSGSVSFAVRTGKSLPTRTLPAVHYVGAFAYESARRIARATRIAEATPQLTGRQYDCVVLVARGKSDWEASRILGLSQATVHQHVQTAMKRFGVTTRTQLVVRALFDCQLSFRDALH